ncbi:hypothetical protein ACRAWF_33815 [Streptomyces sp. L7]
MRGAVRETRNQSDTQREVVQLIARPQAPSPVRPAHRGRADGRPAGIA